MFGLIAIVLLLIAATLIFLPGVRRQLSSQKNKIDSMAGDFDPVAMVQKQVHDTETQIAEARDAMGQYNGFIQTYTRQRDQAIADSKETAQRAQFFAGKGDDVQGQNWFAKKTAADALVIKLNQMISEKTDKYNSQVAVLKSLQRRIDDAKAQAQEKGVELQFSQSEVKMQELEEKTLPDAHGLTEGISKTLDAIDRRIDANKGKINAGKDLHADVYAAAKAEEEYQHSIHSDDYAKFKAGLSSPVAVGA